MPRTIHEKKGQSLKPQIAGHCFINIPISTPLEKPNPPSNNFLQKQVGE